MIFALPFLYRTAAAPIFSSIPEPSVNTFTSGLSLFASSIAWLVLLAVLVLIFGFHSVLNRTALMVSTDCRCMLNLDALLAQYNHLPEAFMLWLLEWPACAIIGGVWPGLPLEHKQDSDGIQVFQGGDFLAPGTVQVSAITYSIPGCQQQYDFIPAILIQFYESTTWLILDDDDDE
jgi:hypothetical protein